MTVTAIPGRSINDSPAVPRAVRLVALAVMLLLFGLWLGGASLFIRGILIDLDTVLEGIFVADTWTPSAVREAADGLGISQAGTAWVWLGIEVIAVVSFGTGGLVLFWRKRDWFGTYIGVAFALIGTNIAGPVTGMLSEIVPSLSPFLGYDGILAILAVLAFASLLYVFPSGRFVPAWTRWFAPAGVVIISVYDFALRDLFGRQETFTSGIDTVFFLSYFAVGLGCQVYRYWRVSDTMERQQSRWIILSFALFLLTLLGGWTLFPNAMSNTTPPRPRDLLGFMVTLSTLSASSTLLIAALAIAILRYRLWDIDVIINRTLTYGMLTVILALAYSGSIVVLQSVFRRVTGQESQLAVVISTLTIAALFTPLRRRVQAFIDRRFYRSKYDVQRTLEVFSDTMRDEVDLARLHNALVNVVNETMQPTHIALWLDEGE